VYWPEWSALTPEVQGRVLRSVATLMNGLTAGAVTSPRDWPAAMQVEHLNFQLDLLRRWANPRRGKTGTAKGS
jgi:hypothetical protein